MKTSLRQRLVLTLLLSVLIGGTIGIIGLYWQTVEELDELFDDRLQAIGDHLTPQTAVTRDQINENETDDGIVIQLWSAEGRLVHASTPDSLAPPPHEEDLVTLTGPDAAWRSYSRALPEGGWLQVAQELSARQEIAFETTARLLLPLLILLPLLAISTSWAISRQLQPLRTLADQLQKGGPQKQVRVVVDHAPTELTPVIEALNDLLARQAEAARKQHAFLADAAHELRTPLTVVGLQLQRLQRAEHEGDRSEALVALKAGVERATRLVTQLLALARSEPDSSEERPMQVLNIEQLMKSVLADLHPLAAHKQIDLGLIASEPCAVLCDSESIRSLLINLVDNAVRHTPPGGRIDVSLQAAGAMAVLLVADTGCGISAERRQAVFGRFVRDGLADSTGTGLGLAIVRQVVERHGGQIVLEGRDEGPGLVVRVTLPLATTRA